jgi:DNA-binding transcriptional LysR family regulator
LMAANHPLSKLEKIPLLELVKYPQVVFKDGYGMQRLVQEWFKHQNVQFKTAMELNTLDAFRGVIRQGEMIALLPHKALTDSYNDSTLAIRPILQPELARSFDEEFDSPPDAHNVLTRQVVMVTTSDRLMIPPIAHFYNLVQDFGKSSRAEKTQLISS